MIPDIGRLIGRGYPSRRRISSKTTNRLEETMESLFQDLRYGLRALTARPVFAAAAVITLALGIGANSAMFSVVKGVLLRPLPYADPEELVSLWTRYLPSSGLDIAQFPLSAPELVDYRDRSRTMEDVVPYRTADRTLTDEAGDPQRIRVGILGAGMFDLLGVRASLGRTFTPEEEVPDAAPTIVLSHELWISRFGGDPEIVGQTVTLHGSSARIVGVMPEKFVFPTARVQLWTPLGLDEANLPGRGAHFLLAVGRLAADASLPQARAELEAITAGWNEEFQHHRMGHFIFLRDLRTDLVGDVRRPLWLLMAAVVLVLLIACVNVANLLLARGESRSHEVAVRTALGASRGRMIRMLLTESLLLSVTGAALGLFLASWSVPALLAINPAAIPRAEGVEVDFGVLLFTGALAVVTTLTFGLAPALQGSAERLATVASEVRSTVGSARTRFRRGLVSAEVALSVVVVVGAGLLVRSFLELTEVDPGIRAESLLTFDLSLPGSEYPSAEEIPFWYARLLERIEGLPGVVSASAVSSLPLTGTPAQQDFQVEGEPPAPSGVPVWNADIVAVHPGYFETMGMTLLRGRTLTRQDGADDPLVIVINQATADKYWPAGGAIGARITYNASADTVAWLNIVGVVSNAKIESLDADPRPQVYLPHHQLRRSQGSTGRSLTVVVRTTMEPEQLVPPIRAVVAELDSNLPLARVRPMEDVVAASVAQPRFTMSLLGSFALIALVLAAVGIYGVVSYAVARRTREIGIRIALGARAVEVIRLMLGEGMRPVVIGGAVGLLLAAGASRILSSLLFEVSATDPATFVSVALLLSGVALLASYLPARRATRVDPVEALRYE